MSFKQAQSFHVAGLRVCLVSRLLWDVILYLGSSFQGSSFFWHAKFIVFRKDLYIDPLCKNY